MNSMSILKVDKLSINVKGVQNTPEKCLLKPISFELNKTERLVILGQTGAGKSLIVQSIMGHCQNSCQAVVTCIYLIN